MGKVENIMVARSGWNNSKYVAFNGIRSTLFSLKPSSIKKDEAGLGCFEEILIDEGLIIGHNYVILVFGNIGGNISITKAYGEGLLSVFMEKFLK